MASNQEILKKYMELLDKRDLDAAMELLTDDVTAVTPLTGSTTGKEAVKSGLQSMPPGPKLEWSEPTEEGDTLKMSASSPFGRLTLVATFSGEKISKFEIKMG
jgi:ketosteroid isomerase-like protein